MLRTRVRFNEVCALQITPEPADNFDTKCVCWPWMRLCDWQSAPTGKIIIKPLSKQKLLVKHLSALNKLLQYPPPRQCAREGLRRALKVWWKGFTGALSGIDSIVKARHHVAKCRYCRFSGRTVKMEENYCVEKSELIEPLQGDWLIFNNHKNSQLWFSKSSAKSAPPKYRT